MTGRTCNKTGRINIRRKSVLHYDCECGIVTVILKLNGVQQHGISMSDTPVSSGSGRINGLVVRIMRSGNQFNYM